jgi:hypothetical protein
LSTQPRRLHWLLLLLLLTQRPMLLLLAWEMQRAPCQLLLLLLVLQGGYQPACGSCRQLCCMAAAPGLSLQQQ